MFPVDENELICSMISRRIVALNIEGESTLRLDFANGAFLTFADVRSCCCEQRFMTTDDKLNDYVGGDLLNVEIVDGGAVEPEEWSVEETQFLRIHTTEGTLTIENHNHHNGYYGGFSVHVRKGQVQ